MKKLLSFGSGYLTFAVAVAMIIVGIYHADTKLILEGVGLFGVRRAINNI